MEYVPNAEALTGYKVKVWRREPFTVVGYTIIVPPDHDADIARFWAEVAADGRLGVLKAASAVPTWVLGLGSWDPECPQGGQRYTICIEQTEHTDFSTLATEETLFATDIGASDWLCFETTHEAYVGRFWQDDPYEMMARLGYGFHTGDFSVGLHFDAYPPGFDPETSPAMEVLITVVKE